MIETPRIINYLRISVTDRCNLKCIYCVPKEGIISKSPMELLSFEEILRLTKILTSLGINKVRLTGGEPLVRRDIINLVESLNKTEGIEEVSLTTNAALLFFYAEALKKSGIKRLNISLDTLRPERFQAISGADCFNQVIEGIKRAKGLRLSPLKLNTVVMKGVNDDEIIDFIEFALSNDLILRFIEFMKITPLWDERFFISIEEVKEICNRKFKLRKIKREGSGPAEYYRIDKGVIGFIKTDERNCLCCSRLRLTSTGELKICMYEEKGIPLKELLRKGFSDEAIAEVIKSKLLIKRDISYKTWDLHKAYMCSLGG